MMNENHIRLATGIHNVTEGSSPCNVMGRLLDFVFLMHDATSLTIDGIITFMREDLCVPFALTRCEIVECALAARKKYAVRMEDRRASDIVLDKHYHKTLKNTWNPYALDDVLSEFARDVIRHETDDRTIKDAIHAWLGILALRSLQDVERMLTGTSRVDIAASARSVGDESVVREFMAWDDKAKDNLIVSAYNVGLAFATMRHKTDLIHAFRPEEHVLNLDDECMMDIVGMNGKMRKHAMETLVRKCGDTGITMRVSALTREKLEKRIIAEVRGFRFSDNNAPVIYDEGICRMRNKRSLTACLKDRIDQAREKFGILTEHDIRHKRRIRKQAKKLKKSLFDAFGKTSLKHHDLWTHLMNLARMRDMDRRRGNNGKAMVYLSADRFFHDLCVDMEAIKCKIWHPARLFSVLLKQSGRMTESDRIAMVAMMKRDASAALAGDAPGYAKDVAEGTIISGKNDEDYENKVTIGLAKK